MFKLIDKLVDRITMYRLVLYFLVGLILAAIILGAIGIVPYSPAAIIYSSFILLLVCWLVNKFFGRFFKVRRKAEVIF
jgi:positive regulator of sigma E activity